MIFAEFSMPIYAYRCEACGFAKDVLQKMSDAPLSDCLSCGKPAFKKQVTAAGFQLKGSGWYVTDFRGGSGGTSAPATAAEPTAGTATTSSSDSGTGSGTAASSDKPAAASGTSTS
jgi:putative FmdB family regulatory protein